MALSQLLRDLNRNAHPDREPEVFFSMTTSAAEVLTVANARFGFGFDVGGTFTDIVVRDASGAVRRHTRRSRRRTIRDRPRQAGPPVRRRGAVGPRSSGGVHGTTLVTNALIERRARTPALVTTSGFRDVLEMRTRDALRHLRPAHHAAGAARAAPPAARGGRARRCRRAACSALDAASSRRSGDASRGRRRGRRASVSCTPTATRARAAGRRVAREHSPSWRCRSRPRWPRRSASTSARRRPSRNAYVQPLVSAT